MTLLTQILTVSLIMPSVLLVGFPSFSTDPSLKYERAMVSTAWAAEPLDINTATEDQLRAALPGIDEAYVKKIIEGRPYKTKEELVQKKILPSDIYDQIKAHIIVRG